MATRTARPTVTKVSMISKGLRYLGMRGNPKDGEKKRRKEHSSSEERDIYIKALT